MEIKELNKQQLLLLAILISFITSIATGIVTVSLMSEAPTNVTFPVSKIIRQTIEKTVPVEIEKETLTDEQKALLNELKAIQPLTVSLYLKGEGDREDKLLGTGLFLGENKVVIASNIDEPQEGEVYVVKSILGERQISKLIPQEDFTIIEFGKDEVEVTLEGEAGTDTANQKTEETGTTTP